MKSNKKKRSGLLPGFAVLCIAAIFSFTLAGCDNPAGGDDDPPKTVAAEYRFTVTDPGFYTYTLGETSLVYIGPNAFTLDGVYTEGGGTYSDRGDYNEDGTWAYLCDATGKRGIVYKVTSGSDTGLRGVRLGATEIERSIGYPGLTFTPPLSADGMSANPACAQTSSP
jgi:hypothetical protein